MIRLLVLALLLLPSLALAQTGVVSGASVIATGATTARTLADRFSERINLKDYGAKGDALAFSTGSAASPGVTGPNGTISASSNAFTATTSTTFTASDVGKSITIDGAGAGAGPLATTIASVTGAHSVTLSANATTATPLFQLAGCPVTTDQSGGGSYAPSDTITLSGGTGTAAVCTVQATQVHSASVNAGGSGGTNGSCVLTGTTGVTADGGGRFQINATISGGAVTALSSFVDQSTYTTNPTLLTAEPVTGCGLTGATLSVVMGVKYAWVSNKGLYSALPTQPIGQASTSGSGTGATFSPLTNATGSFVYGTDDSAALAAAIGAVNAKQAAGVPATLYIPPGTYLIRSTPAPSFTGTAGIVGDGPLKSVIRIDTPYSGDLFSWSQSNWGDYPYNGTTPALASQFAGTFVSGIGVVGDLSAPSQQNAFVFYDRTNHLRMENVDVLYLNGRGFYAGVLKNATVGYLEESSLSHVKVFNAGTPSVAAVDISAVGGGSGDIVLNGMQIYAPASVGLWLHSSNNQMTNVWASGLRIEGLEHASNNNSGDLLEIGDSSGSGAVVNLQVVSSTFIDPYPGSAAVHVLNPSGQGFASTGINISGSVQGGDARGKGLWLSGASNSSYFMSTIGTTDYNVQVDSSTFVGTNNTISTSSAPTSLTALVDGTSANHISWPSYATQAGNIIAGPQPDNTTLGGATRGAQATDLQISRAASVDVASGAQSVIAGGTSNTASGSASSVLGGSGNIAQGLFSTVVGGQSNQASGTAGAIPGGRLAFDRGSYGVECFATGDFATRGDAQRCTYILRGTTSNTSPVTLTSDQLAPSTINCVNTTTGTAYAIAIDVVALDESTKTNNEAWEGWVGKLAQPGNAGSTVVSMGTKPTPQTSGTVTGSDIAVSADTTNGCLALSFTPPTSNTDAWRMVATVRTVQVQ